MKEEKQKCWNCLYFNAYYTKNPRYFNKLDIGHCQRHKKIVDEQAWCEGWRDGLLSKHIRKRALSEQFTEIIHKLNVIEQELKGDINVNEL